MTWSSGDALVVVIGLALFALIGWLLATAIRATTRTTK